MLDNTILIAKIDQLIYVLKQPIFYENWAFWNFLVLTITLIFLIIYTIYTKKLADQAKETNLRPIILRSGDIKSFNDIRYIDKDFKECGSELLSFFISKNIATDISGYLIIGGMQYNLLFGSPKINLIKEGKVCYRLNFGWMNVGETLNAIYVKEAGKKINKPNKIVLSYKDIQGGCYYTIEDDNFRQLTYKGELNFKI